MIWGFSGVLALLLILRFALIWMVSSSWISYLMILHGLTILCDVFLMANGIYFAQTVKSSAYYLGVVINIFH